MADLSEREALLLFVQHIRAAESAARMVGTTRLDLRWIGVARHLAEMQQRCAALVARRTAA